MSFTARPLPPGPWVRLRPWRLHAALALLALVATGASPAPTGSAAPEPVPALLPAPATAVVERADRAPVTPPTPATAVLTRSRPTHVRIPAIGVDAGLVGLGLRDDGSMQVPPGAFPAGWYTGSPTPGELGPAVLAGHVDYGGTAGVFHRLHRLRAGDTVAVDRADGSTAVFRVTRVEQHRKDAFPTAAVYGDIDHAGLRLITCGGTFDRGAHSYVDNIVAFAALVDA